MIQKPEVEKSGHGLKKNESTKLASSTFLGECCGMVICLEVLVKIFNAKSKFIHEALLKDELNSVAFLQPVLQIRLLTVYLSYSLILYTFVSQVNSLIYLLIQQC